MRASEKAYQSLHADIVQWRIPPGTVLAEVELSERLHVSRTPVREAVSRLIADGLAAPRGGRGVVVSDISLDDVRKLYELRQTLEVKAAELSATHDDGATFAALAGQFSAARHRIADRAHDPGPQTLGGAQEPYYALTADLDAALDAACGNRFLVAALANLRPQLARVRRMSQEHPQRLAETACEHAAICTAIAEHNPDMAAATTTVHLSHSLNHILHAAEPPSLKSHHPTEEGVSA